MDKVVLFIVEGATDKRALESIFKKIYRNKNVHFEFTHGDITSDETISKQNVENEIYKYVKSYMDMYNVRKSDRRKRVFVDTEKTNERLWCRFYVNFLKKIP